MTAETASSDRERGRRDARTIWNAAIHAIQPAELVERAITRAEWLNSARRIIVLGGGKAGAGMAAGVEAALADRPDRLTGVVNVPADTARPMTVIHLNAARPTGANEPTAEGVAGTEEMLRLAAEARPDDVGLVLISGGGSALLPAPVPGVSLADKQAVTRLLHRTGATINEMNCVRKHLSRFKGGRLAEAFRGRRLFGYIISDVVGDPLDVIASGPTVADPTTFADALAVLDRFGIQTESPESVRRHLEDGSAGRHAETPKALPETVENRVLGNNHGALAAAERQATELGYRTVNLGAFIEGETVAVAGVVAGIVRSIRADGCPAAPPVCLLIGGETTVTLPPRHGQGGRNQEFVLAMMTRLSEQDLIGVTILSGGTDGEDGPTDAAGALADLTTVATARRLGLSATEFLSRHDAYYFFRATNDLLLTGLTGTNVMDVRVILMRPD